MQNLPKIKICSYWATIESNNRFNNNRRRTMNKERATSL